MEKDKFDIDFTLNDDDYIVKIHIGKEVGKTFIKKEVVQNHLMPVHFTTIVSEDEWREDLIDREEFEKLTEVKEKFEFWSGFVKFWDNYDLKKFHEVVQAKKSRPSEKRIETISVIHKWFKKTFILQVEGNFETEMFKVEYDSRKEYRKMKKWGGKEWDNFLKNEKLF